MNSNTNYNEMTTRTLAAAISLKLIACGVTIKALPGGTVQLLGKYGDMMLTHDVTSLQPKQIARLCGALA